VNGYWFPILLPLENESFFSNCCVNFSSLASYIALKEEENCIHFLHCECYQSVTSQLVRSPSASFNIKPVIIITKIYCQCNSAYSTKFLTADYTTILYTKVILTFFTSCDLWCQVKVEFVIVQC